MERKLRYVLCLVFLFGTFFISRAYSQAPNQLVVDKAIQVNLRHPTPYSNRYLENNKRKKKVKAKVKMNNNSRCHAYLSYQSQPEKKREKAVSKKRKKLQ